MSFETISLLLNWMEMGALLAILFRLSRTFELIASTQRELRRAILRERRVAELDITNGFHGPGIELPSRSRQAHASGCTFVEVICRYETSPQRSSGC